jgi:crotonobetaine/carnitine-CoA ligase
MPPRCAAGNPEEELVLTAADKRSFDHVSGRGQTLQRVFAEHAAAHPDAHWCESAGQVYTYGAFDAVANQVAHGLTARGIGRGDAVAVYMSNRPEFFYGMFGLQRAGGLYVPCSTIHTPDELVYQLDHIEAKAIFVDETTYPSFAAVRDQLPGIETCVIQGGPAVDGAITLDELIAGQSDAWPETAAELTADDLALVIYTSGTTARPKGVIFNHGALLTAAETFARVFNWSVGERFFSYFPLYHSNGGLIGLGPAVFARATMVMVPAFSATRFVDQLRELDITFCNLNSSHVRMLLNQPPTDRDADHNVRRMMQGLTLEPHEILEFEQRFGTVLMPTYGLTESLGICVANGPVGNRRVGSAGRVLRGFSIEIWDDEDNPLPVGEAGEIVITCDGPYGRALRYHKDEEHTAATFIGDTVRSGDMGRMDEDGFLWFVQRKKDMIKRSGFNVAAAEVERVLLTHDGVAAAAVVGTPDLMRDEAIVAYVVREPGSEVGRNELFDLCDEALADYKVPQVIEFRDALPLNFLGKVEYRRLRDDALVYRVDTRERLPVGHHVRDPEPTSA